MRSPSWHAACRSASAEAHDRGGKWQGYRRLSSLDDYVLVAQRTVSVKHYQRQTDGSWRYTVAGPGESVLLANGARLDIDGIYEGVFDLSGDEETSLSLSQGTP